MTPNRRSTDDEFRRYMEEGREWRESVTRYMAEGNVHTRNFLEYIQKCDEDRGDHSDRLGSLERTRAAQNAVIAAAVSLFTVVGAWAEFFKK